MVLSFLSAHAISKKKKWTCRIDSNQYNSEGKRYGRNPEEEPECLYLGGKDWDVQKRTDHGVNHGSSGSVMLSFCRRTLATIPSDLVNHVYDGSCGNHRRLIELPRTKSQVEKRCHMPYRVTFHRTRHDEAPMVHNKLEKKKGVLWVHVAS